MRLNLNISPCPNDTFMFDALASGRISTGDLQFDIVFADIDELNSLAIRGLADVCKVSYAVLPLIEKEYRMLGSGSALGWGNGPLLVARNSPLPVDPHVAVPGEYTTAKLLISRLLSNVERFTSVLFSQIAERVAAGEFDAGVLIHEGRFTYRAHGLHKVADLGEEWGRRTHLPLPLGGIAVARRLGDDVFRQVENLVRASVRYAFDHPGVSRDFVREHAREMDEGVISSHIDLFVNRFSIDLGDEGRRAVEALTGVKL